MTDQELLRAAEAGDNVAAARLWILIARGRCDEGVTLAWARNVAQHIEAKVLEADLQANRRPDAALKAIGLEGRMDWLGAVLTEYGEDWTPSALAEVLPLVEELGPYEGKDPKQLERAIRHKRKRTT